MYFLPRAHFCGSDIEWRIITIEIGEWMMRKVLNRPSRYQFFKMRNIWKTVPDRYTITIEQTVRFVESDHMP